MAHTAMFLLTISLLLTGIIEHCETAKERGVNVTIYRGLSFDFLSSLSPLFPCCDSFNAHAGLNTSCRCSQADSSFYEGNRSCVSIKQLWNEEGCHFMFAGDKEDTPIRVLSATTGILKLNKDPKLKCKFDIKGQSSNKYLGCSGEWITIAADHIRNMFSLITRYQTEVYLELSSKHTASLTYKYLLGRLVKLEVKCQDRIIHERHSCVMFKIEGSTTCTLPLTKRTNNSGYCLSLSPTWKDFQKLSSSFGQISVVVRTHFIAFLVEAIILLLAISTVIMICTFRKRNRSNRRIPGSPSYYRTESTKRLKSSCEVESDYADPVDVLPLSDSTDCSAAQDSGQFGDCKDWISNPTYERGPDRLSVIETRGDVIDLLSRTPPRPQKRQYTQPPPSNVTPRNASRKPFSMHATISEEGEGLQENLYSDVCDDVRVETLNDRKAKLRYSDPFPAGPHGVFQGSRKAPLARHYYEEAVIYEYPGQVIRSAPGHENHPRATKAVIYEHPGQVIHSAPGHENQPRATADEILPDSRAPTLRLVGAEPTYVNAQMVNSVYQSLSPINNDASIQLDNTTDEHVYATLCCENPNDCVCDEGYGSSVRDNTAALN